MMNFYDNVFKWVPNFIISSICIEVKINEHFAFEIKTIIQKFDRIQNYSFRGLIYLHNLGRPSIK